MADEGSVRTIRAAVEAILPGDGDVPSGVDAGVERHVADLADQYLPGFADVIAALLNAYAMEATGQAFADLDVAGRHAALRAMASEGSVDVRDAADALFAFTYGGHYSEWSGFDRERRTLTPPASWAAIGFEGPAIAHPDFGREDEGPHPDVRTLEPEPPA
jgi:hypothetical protein